MMVCSHRTEARSPRARDKRNAIGAATKDRSAPSLVCANAVPSAKAAVAKKSETVKPMAAAVPTTSRSRINGPNQQERSLESIRVGPQAYTLACEEASPDEPHTEE